MRRGDCTCAAGSHSLGRHEPFCQTFGAYCEDCRQPRCRCRVTVTELDPYIDPWKETA